MTIGYNIYFPTTIGLELKNFPSEWNEQYNRLTKFAQSLQWIMHEMEHTSQFFKADCDKANRLFLTLPGRKSTTPLQGISSVCTAP